MTDARTEARWDHLRDLRKHDPNPLPLSVQTAPLSTAMDIVVLVKALTDYTAAANLVDQYAQTVAAGARLEAVELTANRILTTLGASDAKA